MGLFSQDWTRTTVSFKSSGQGLPTATVTTSRTTSQVHALLEVTELKRNRTHDRFFTCSHLLHVPHLKFLCSTPDSSGSLRTNIEVVGGRGGG